MSQSKAARRLTRNHARYRGRNELNVVPMIDMMVILVFFLIFTAVFTKTNVLELNLPGADAAVPDLPEGLNLEVIVRKTGIEVADRGTGVLKTLPTTGADYDLQGLSDYLQLVKSKYPDKSAASILLEQEVQYDTLVHVMDTVRVFAVPGSQWAVGELFPDVSVGGRTDMTSYRIKRHRKRTHHGAGGHMTLVPFIDILTIMVVFLLFNTSDVDVLPNNKNISIPESLSEKKPRPTVVVMITKDDLLVDGRSVISVKELIASPDAVIAPLKAALMSQADSVLADSARDEVKEREVTILGDRNTPYSVLRKIMATCTDAEYGKVSLAVTSGDRPPAVSGTAAGRTASLTAPTRGGT